MSLSFDLDTFFNSAKDMIDIVRANEVGTYIDIIMIVLTVLLALIFVWEFSSGSRSSTEQ
jgi:hypothetical protein